MREVLGPLGSWTFVNCDRSSAIINYCTHVRMCLPSAALSRKCSSVWKDCSSGYLSWMMLTMKCISVCFRSVDLVSNSLGEPAKNEKSDIRLIKTTVCTKYYWIIYRNSNRSKKPSVAAGKNYINFLTKSKLCRRKPYAAPRLLLFM